MSQITPPKQRAISIRQKVAIGIGLLVSVFFLYLAFRELQPEAFFNSLSDVNLLWLIIAAATYGLAVLVITLRWQFLLRAVRLVPLWSLSQIVAIGYMGNNVYPARAGEVGRGFAVVAQEVKNLANQTAKATEEVSSQIGALQSQIKVVTDGIASVSTVMVELSKLFASIAQATEEQQSATNEISINAQQAALGADTAARTIGAVEEFSSTNLAATKVLSSAADRVVEANDNLSEQSKQIVQALQKKD